MPETVANSELCLLVDGDLSGDLPVGRRKRLEARVAAAPQAAERLALWRRNDAVLRLAVRDERPGPGVGGLDVKHRITADRIAAPPMRLAQPDDDPIPASAFAPGPDTSARTMADPAQAGFDKAGFDNASAVFAGGAACGAFALAALLLVGWV